MYSPENDSVVGGVVRLTINADVAKKLSPPSPADSTGSSGGSSDGELSSNDSSSNIAARHSNSGSSSDLELKIANGDFHGYKDANGYHGKIRGSNADEAQLKLSHIVESKDYLMSRTQYRPAIAIICGSGLGELADQLTNTDVFHYHEIPNFTTGSVPGHAGMLVFGTLNGKSVVCMKGRVHAYEGHPMWQITFPIRVFAAMGVNVLVVTNASGGLNPSYKSCDVMIIKDHINLAGLVGLNPFVGLNDERFGTRFCALSGAYDQHLRSLAWNVGRDLNMTSILREGVYVCQIGPTYETVAESRMMQILGADAAGMSTVFEVSVARHVGMRCLGLSLITNACETEYDSSREAVSHAEVLESSRRRAEDLKRFVSGIVGAIDVTKL